MLLDSPGNRSGSKSNRCCVLINLLLKRWRKPSRHGINVDSEKKAILWGGHKINRWRGVVTQDRSQWRLCQSLPKFGGTGDMSLSGWSTLHVREGWRFPNPLVVNSIPQSSVLCILYYRVYQANVTKPGWPPHWYGCKHSGTCSQTLQLLVTGHCC